MTEPVTLKMQNGVFDLDSFQEVLLKKEIAFTPAATVQEAQERLGNDTAKFLDIVNEGLASEVRRAERAKPEGWFTQEDDEAEKVPFSGVMANVKMVNATILTLAKTVFGYNKDQKPEEKKASKAAAMELVKNNAQIREGLRKSAAIAANDSEE